MNGQLFATITLVSLGAALVTGGGSQPTIGGLAGRSTPITAEVETPTVTLADDGQTLRLHPGQRFLLNLGEGYDWTVIPADPEIVSRVVNVQTIRGSQGLYEAHKPGRTTLTATGDPPCRKVKPPCTIPSRLFRLQVVVQG